MNYGIIIYNKINTFGDTNLTTFILGQGKYVMENLRWRYGNVFKKGT